MRRWWRWWIIFFLWFVRLYQYSELWAASVYIFSFEVAKPATRSRFLLILILSFVFLRRFFFFFIIIVFLYLVLLIFIFSSRSDLIATFRKRLNGFAYVIRLSWLCFLLMAVCGWQFYLFFFFFFFCCMLKPIKLTLTNAKINAERRNWEKAMSKFLRSNARIKITTILNTRI